MLNSLVIKNFRNLRDFKLTSLSRVNLFTGKNNTGKSTILEALTIFASKGDLTSIFQLLDERGEGYRITNTAKDATELNIKALSSLFTERKIGYELKNAISIGAIEQTLFGEQTSPEKFVSIRFVRYHDEISSNSQIESRPTIRKRTIITEENNGSFIDYNIGLEIRTGNNSSIFQLDRERPYRLMFRSSADVENYQFIRTRNIDREINGKLWDNITLTEKEKYIIDALKIIEPHVERIAFIEENTRERTAVIKLEGNNAVVPLRSMGDGINRVLTIILALVNSDGGFLLIDEFENGLHYTVQKKLWEIIFNLSQILDVQVFATTHSGDCITSFEEVLNDLSKNASMGKLIRLDYKDGTVSQVEFDADELRIATEHEIETR